MHRLITRISPVIAALSVAASCSSPDETGAAPITTVDPPAPLPLLTIASLTTELTWIPAHAIVEATLARDPAVPAAMDYRIEGDPIAADGRARSVVDLTSGWTGDGSGTLDGRNVALWIKKPQ